jgi:hypothetical protein
MHLFYVEAGISIYSIFYKKILQKRSITYRLGMFGSTFA